MLHSCKEALRFLYVKQIMHYNFLTSCYDRDSKIIPAQKILLCVFMTFHLEAVKVKPGYDHTFPFLKAIPDLRGAVSILSMTTKFSMQPLLRNRRSI